MVQWGSVGLCGGRIVMVVLRGGSLLWEIDLYGMSGWMDGDGWGTEVGGLGWFQGGVSVAVAPST